MPHWYAAEPDIITTGRLSLDFGLRASDLFFRELVVPGLGGVSFVRQLSWATAALALHEGMGRPRLPTPTEVAHGLEALGCKLAWGDDPEDRTRLAGSRAFARDAEVFDFKRLSQRRHYVQVTWRQGTVRALRGPGSLGLAAGTRYNALSLTDPGRDLAFAFLSQPVGRGSASLEKTLLRWLRGEDAPRSSSVLRALSPRTPTPAEYDRVMGRVRGLGGADIAGAKRARLARCLEREVLPDLDEAVPAALVAIGFPEQAAELRAARAFGAFFDRTREVATSLTRPLDAAGGVTKLEAAAGHPEVAAAIGRLRAAAETHLERLAAASVQEPLSADLAVRLRAARSDTQRVALVAAQPNHLVCVDGRTLRRGPLYRVLAAAPAEEEEGPPDPLASDRTFRVRALHQLLHDRPEGP